MRTKLVDIFTTMIILAATLAGQEPKMPIAAPEAEWERIVMFRLQEYATLTDRDSRLMLLRGLKTIYGLSDATVQRFVNVADECAGETTAIRDEPATAGASPTEATEFEQNRARRSIAIRELFARKFLLLLTAAENRAVYDKLVVMSLGRDQTLR